MERIACAGAVALDDGGRLLLIRRGTPPGIGKWSIPGGRCEPGESPVSTCIREAKEETGLDLVVDRPLGTVVRPGRDPGTEYEITDYLCTVGGGRLEAGDDATAVTWAGRGDLIALDLSEGLIAALVGWGVLPPAD